MNEDGCERQDQIALTILQVIALLAFVFTAPPFRRQIPI
jgi:hypothetical protein